MKVEDDYIKDKELQDGLSKSKANGMNWWDGKEEYKPHAHIHDLIKQVWPVHIYEGFEYWINDYPVGDQLDWHNDKDEYAYKHFDTIIMPAEGIVYYTHADDVEGGVLEITNGDKDVKIHTKKNRLVKFMMKIYEVLILIALVLLVLFHQHPPESENIDLLFQSFDSLVLQTLDLQVYQSE